MLKIRVLPVKVGITTADGLEMKVSGAVARNGEAPWCSLADYYRPESDLEIRTGFFGRILRIDPITKAGILKFIRQYGESKDMFFDCYAFVGSVRGVLSHTVEYMLAFWKVRRLRWRRPAVGSVVFLTIEEECAFRHAAIYVGRGLYISVYGGGGGLEISTLADMKHDFGARDVLLAMPYS
jgi:hypothetical protein